MPNLACGQTVDSQLVTRWVGGGVSSTALADWMTKLVEAVVNALFIHRLALTSPTSYPQVERPNLPLSEHTFYPVSTASTNTPTRKERIL